MKSQHFGIAISIVLISLAPLYAQEWSWNTSNELLNPYGITVTPPTSPFLFDIDSDADLDLVIGQGDGTIVLYRNNGFPNTPRWQEDTGYFSEFDFAYLVAPTLGDIDNDDSLELVLSFKEAGQWPVDTVKVYRNRGTIFDPVWMELTGYFNSHSDIEFPVGSHKLIDWDDDGDLDLITEGALSASGYLFFVNTGAPGNPFWSIDSTMTSDLHFDFAICGCEGFDIADFDNDGAYDIIMSYQVCDDGSELALFINQGTNVVPQFPPYPDVSFYPGSGYANNLTAGDIDRDGDIDLISGGSFPQMSYYQNNGNAGSPIFDGPGNADFCGPYYSGGRAFALLDHENDTDLDMIMMGVYAIFNPFPYPHYDPYMEYHSLDNSGDQYQPEFSPATWFYNPFLPVLDYSFSTGDLNGDSLADIAWNWADDIIGFLNVRDSSFRRNDPLFADINQAGDFRNSELVDLNSDNKLDLVVVNYATHILTAFENTGTAYIPAWTEHSSWIDSLDLSASYVNVAYLNSDFLPDLVLKTGNIVSAYLNVGSSANPVFRHTPEVFQSIQGFDVDYFDMADLDGDGDDDLIASNSGMLIFVENQSVVGAYSDAGQLPLGFNLFSHPNPFNASTTILYSLSQSGPVSIDIFNILGQRVARLEEGNQPAGEYRAVWNAKDHPSGVYFARLEAGERSQTIKLVLLK